VNAVPPGNDQFLAGVAAGESAAAEDLAANPGLVHASTADGGTALHIAARHGHRGMVEALLDAGAQIDARTSTSRESRTALHDSYEYGQPDITQLLIERGAHYDINVASARGDFARVDTILVDKPELVNDDSTGLSPLGWAGYGQDPAMVSHLVARGAVLRDEMCCACATGNTEIIAAFLDSGSSPNALSPKWRARPLHVAVAMPYSTNSTAAVNLLLDVGADRNLPAGDGITTPLDLARRLTKHCDSTAHRDRIASYAEIIALLELST
jgi:ankyrin repeat protein